MYLRFGFGGYREFFDFFLFRCLYQYNTESHDGVVRVCLMRIWSNRYDLTTWALDPTIYLESKTGYYFGLISFENKA